MVGGNMGAPNGGIGQAGQNQGAGSSEVVDTMTDRIMNGMFKDGKFQPPSGTKEGGGDQFSDDKLAEGVAKFMDNNPDKYGSPDDSTGRVRNWNQELAEDNGMNKDEMAAFQKGLKDYLAQNFRGNGDSTQANGGVPGSRGGTTPGGRSPDLGSREGLDFNDIPGKDSILGGPGKFEGSNNFGERGLEGLRDLNNILGDPKKFGGISVDGPGQKDLNIFGGPGKFAGLNMPEVVDGPGQKDLNIVGGPGKFAGGDPVFNVNPGIGRPDNFGPEVNNPYAGLTDLLANPGVNSGIAGGSGQGPVMNSIGTKALDSAITGDKNGGGQVSSPFSQMLQIVAKMMDGTGIFGSPRAA